MKEFNNESIMRILDQASPKDKLICMLYTDGWQISVIQEYFAGSVWESTEDEINESLMKVRELIHNEI